MNPSSRLAATFAIVAMVASCSDSSPAPPSLSPPAGSTVAMEALPIAWYLLEQSNGNRVIQTATARAIQKCMKEQGFSYEPIKYVPDVDYLGKRYGVSPDVSAKIGFQSLDALSDKQPDELLEPPMPGGAEGVRYERALFGTEGESTTVTMKPADGTGAPISVQYQGGCVGEARRAIFGDNDKATEYNGLDLLLQSIDQNAYLSAKASAPVVDALTKWSACMQSRGYVYESRDALLTTGWPSPRPTTKEIEIATADSTCLEEVNYKATYLAVEVVEEQRLVEQHVAEIEEYKQLRKAVLNRAAELAS